MCLHPRERFPTEMWVAILRHLTSPQDLYNLTLVHPFFAELLEPQLPNIQIQLVLPVLLQSTEDKWDDKIAFTGPGHLSQSDALKCRLVCKSWDSMMRDFFESPINPSPPFIDMRKLTRNQFSNGPGLDPTQKAWFSFHFTTNRFSLAEGGTQQPTLYRRWLESTLISHPPQSDAHPFTSRSWDSTIYWNLTSLSLSMHETIDREVALIPPEAVTALQNYIQAHPMPELLHLATLHLESFPLPIQNELVERYHHVTAVYLCPRDRDSHCGDLRLALAPLGDWLQRLQLTIRTEEDMLMLERCDVPSWLHLRHLGVDFSLEYTRSRRMRSIGNTYSSWVAVEPYAPSWEMIIGMLNRLFGQAPRLTELALCLPRYEPSQEAAVLRDTQRCRLQLRNVVQLKLRLMNPAILVDFLLPMKNSLQKVAIEYMWAGVQAGDFPPNEKVDIPEKVFWNGLLGKKLLNSNLWIVFPKLDFLRVESYKGWTYRRRIGSQPIMINPDGTEESMDEEDYEEEDEGDNAVMAEPEVRVEVQEDRVQAQRCSIL